MNLNQALTRSHLVVNASGEVILFVRQSQVKEQATPWYSMATQDTKGGPWQPVNKAFYGLGQVDKAVHLNQSWNVDDEKWEALYDYFLRQQDRTTKLASLLGESQRLTDTASKILLGETELLAREEIEHAPTIKKTTGQRFALPTFLRVASKNA